MISYKKICKKCNKMLKTNEETYDGLCLNCYQNYLFEKVEHLGERIPKKESSLSIFFKKIFHFKQNKK